MGEHGRSGRALAVVGERWEEGRLRRWRLWLGAVGLAAALVTALAPVARAEFSSKKVAYIYDKALFPCTTACGLNDTNYPGGSIFTDAVEGKIAKGEQEGTYTPSGGEEATLKNVTLEELDANPHLLQEQGFDTAILYQTCRIAEHPAALAQINAFLESAHKVMIFDADGCSPPGSGGKGEPNWSGFLFPFATNNPGPEGAEGNYTAVEPSSLTTGLSVGPQELDAVGDANIFTSSSVHWFQAIAATNVHGVNGTVMAYSRTASGGLALYEGEDFWFTDTPDPHLKQVFDNLLNQHWNPDKLPGTTFVCTTCATVVTTKLSSTLVPANTPVTDSATVVGASGAGTATGNVTFTVYSDSNCQLPVAGRAQSVSLSTGSTSPITLPPGSYYFQAQYFGDANNEPGISACGSEVLTVEAPPPPPKPPVPLKRIFVYVETGELEWEVEVLEEGELEWEAEVFEGGEVFGPNGELARFLNFGLGNEGVAFNARAKHKKKCKKGFVRKGKKCVNNAPIKYGRVHVAVTPGHYKLRIKPNKTVLNALKKGRKLRVKTRLTFVPTRVKTTHLTQTSSTTVHLTKKHKKKHHHK